MVGQLGDLGRVEEPHLLPLHLGQLTAELGTDCEPEAP
jgi:hypothetical protein